MSREVIAYSVSDISALAKSLRAQMAAREAPPGHVEMLNILARAAGHRNFQHLRAQANARDALERPAPPAAVPLDHVLVQRAARYFDADGKLAQWPARTGLQHLCVWALWAQVPPGEVFSERQISLLLNTLHNFGDAAILRRVLSENGLMTRTRDGRIYCRREQAPPPEAAALIRYLELRRRSAAQPR
ncbi:DUF2087 domain-containing protein [Sphingomonas canadensis]|uniref:DUF2087 domain-containing protein n=1 Tax=Sphingomonas canadensis TaxID=1219257 RepID=A0ABW3H3X4_9SPHN|nr:DUF2087 domain-containing protein [Sphingomonas canadensis]MCW3835519.1 DUF2087 domain-containing protein [Sphingomonas canadensis]